MRKLIVDGRFLTQKLTGMQRFALEVLRVFAQTEDLEVTVAAPKGAHAEIEGIRFEQIGSHGGTRWEQFELARYCRRQGLPLLCMANAAPVFYRSNVVLHDILWIDFPKSAPHSSWAKKFKWMVRTFVYRAPALLTVSEFSKERILARFPRRKRPPAVVGCGHEHTARWIETPVSVPEKFFLTVGSAYEHKNFKYIATLAQRHPELNFVITGNRVEEYRAQLPQGVNNCFFTGYTEDGALKWLYRRCEGFILPSRYEGFGLPPLEAVACGCRKLYLADIPVFREVYGGCASYFGESGDLDLSAPSMTEEAAQELLSRFSWKKTADAILRAVFEEKV